MHYRAEYDADRNSDADPLCSAHASNLCNAPPAPTSMLPTTRIFKGQQPPGLAANLRRAELDLS